MKVLVTGAGGFIANNIANLLQKSPGYEVIGTYRRNRPLREAVSQCICCDLCQAPEKLMGLQFDAVVHFASQLYGSGIRGFLDNTVQATRNLIDIAECKGVQRFIYISTISVCGETRGVIDERSDRINLNDYEAAKWIGERLLEDSRLGGKVIIRLPRVLGKGIDLAAPWLPKVSYSILKGEDVTYYNPGMKYNALVHTDGLFQFITHILQGRGSKDGIYMLGSEGEMTILEILTFLKERFHSRSELVKVEATGADRCHSIDISKAKAAGFEADTVQGVLEKYVRDLKGVV